MLTATDQQQRRSGWEAAYPGVGRGAERSAVVALCCCVWMVLVAVVCPYHDEMVASAASSGERLEDDGGGGPAGSAAAVRRRPPRLCALPVPLQVTEIALCRSSGRGYTHCGPVVRGTAFSSNLDNF